MSRVHVIARDNGAGLSRDLRIVGNVLAQAGFDVTTTAVGQGGLARTAQYVRLRSRVALHALRGAAGRGRFDVNVSMERILPQFLSLARRNVLVPNPEWFMPEHRPYLPSMDRVFAKTRHAVPIFEALGCRSEYVGFTSDDRRSTGGAREPTFLHVAGRSGNKGTRPLVALWKRRPAWPLLTVVQRSAAPVRDVAPNVRLVTRYVGDEELRALQNRNLFHLCPSETEGFGHHLVEALSVGAIVLTTDAPPMNELVTPGRGVLVPHAHAGTQRLATTYFVDDRALEAGVERLLSLTDAERRAMSDDARGWYEASRRAFAERFVRAVDDCAAA